jgi:hypothetical protein
MTIEVSNNLLSSFSEQMVKERDKAVEARKESGLDDIWKKAREQYQGIDEVNRARSVSKSRTLDGPIQTTMGKVGAEKRSTVFVNITRPYTNAGVARVSDILLPTGGKRNWDLRGTPISDISLLRTFVAEHPELAEQLPEELQARLMQSPEEQEAAIEEARRLIDDWLTETRWHNHTRKQISEAGKVGTGIIKGPFPKKKKLSLEVQATMLAIQLGVEDPNEQRLLRETLRTRIEFQPALECIPVENLYPDMPSCGDSIHNGRFIWEEIPNVGRPKLQELACSGDYLEGQMAEVLDEEPKPCTAKGESADKKKKSYTRWRRTGEIDLGKVMGDPEAGVTYAEVEIINDRVVKVSKPALDLEAFPYHVLVWEPRQDSWAGIGIPEQIETPQRGLNASVRAGNDNMGWSVGFQVILGKGLEPVNGSDTEIEPYKLWRDVTDALEALTGKDRAARDAIGTIEFPNHLDKILAWIEFWLRMAESTTGLSLLLQGHKSSDSVGVSQMQMNSATTNLRMFVKHWDDDNCSPIIQQMYQWVQQYGPEVARGDAVAQALGSSVLITRDLQQQLLVQLLDRFVQPVYGKSPAKGMDMILEAAQFDPRQLDLSDEERERLEAASAEPDPKVQVEQLRSETDRLIEQMRDERERLKMMLDAQAKGASLDQAADAVETQTAGNLALESMKQEGAVEQKAMEVANLAEGGAKPKEAPGPDIDESLDILGIG